MLRFQIMHSKTQLITNYLKKTTSTTLRAVPQRFLGLHSSTPWTTFGLPIPATYSKETATAWVSTKATISPASRRWSNLVLKSVFSPPTRMTCPSARHTLAVTASPTIYPAQAPSATRTRASFTSSQAEQTLSRQRRRHLSRTPFQAQQGIRCD